MLCDERYSNDSHKKQNEMKHETRNFQRIDKNKIKFDVILKTYSISIFVY